MSQMGAEKPRELPELQTYELMEEIEDIRMRDIAGERFGHLTAIRYDHKGKYRSYWLCRCDCGKDCIVSRQNLTSGKTQSCGHLRSRGPRMTRGKFHHLQLSEKDKAWIIKHYCHTKNDEIKERFGLTDGTLHRFARANGLKKTTQFVHKCQRDAAAAAFKSHKENGTFPPKGYRVPFSGEHCFKAGITRKETPKQKAQRIGKAAATMREIRMKERARIRMGWPQQTKLRLVLMPETARRRNFRHNLRLRGYHVARGENVAYYDENTKRSMIIENRKNGDRNYIYFEFKPLAEQ